ncbi:MAG TPA: S-adenosylmethionine:tRNA ribosyltransferase-isomerase [Acidimicrobiales bacterium]|nr:S-adenosylmethionine:tRNA ribosyltransferase-isomerase [Acidimicrobiales bacterium]
MSARSTAVFAASRLEFELPAELEAAEPPEARGMTRDAVRMMVTRVSTGEVIHSTFSTLPAFLDEGDLVVVNTSGTLPAALQAVGDDGTAIVVHLSTHLSGRRWVVEPRRPVQGTTERWSGPAPPRRLELGDGATATLESGYGPGGRLWVAELLVPGRLLSWLAVHGSPIRYRHVPRPWPLSMYQNVYATEPGSAEMPGAGRPFTPEVLTRLVAKGVAVSPVVLHTGVASLEADEVPYPERLRVPAVTAGRVDATRRSGHHVVAVGTTVVRALETAATPGGQARAVEGWTDVVISPERGVRLVDGLLTGWHETASSHLLLLEALCGCERLEGWYDEALAEGYRFHEFGDVHLILP